VSRYVITGPAKRDLADLFDYLAEDDPSAALRLDDAFREAFRNLAKLPYMGRSQEHRRPNLRSWIVGKYLIFYRPLSDGIEVIRVLHGRRDLDALL
jgi:toxin ParE1/3/4